MGERTVEVTLPQLGETVAEGTVLRWLKRPGDPVEADEDLCEVSTDKVDTEIPCPATGRLAEVLVEEGETVEVGAVLARLVVEGEVRSRSGPEGTGGLDEPGVAEGDAAPEEEPLHFEDSSIDLFGSRGSTTGEDAPEEAPAPAREDHRDPGRRRATPAVRRLARERGVDLTALRGSGPGGRLTRGDVLAAAEGIPAEVEAAAPSGADADRRIEAGSARVEALSPVRRAIARRMAESKRTIPHVTTVMEVDLTLVAGIRNRTRTAFEETHGCPLTYMPFVLRAAVDALERHPVFNASLVEDEIRFHERVHLGLAVATDAGLIVPVLPSADTLSLPELALGIVDLASRARDGALEPDDVRGGTFTVTNHGRSGSLMGTPIIVPPQTAILGIGKIEDAARVLDGAVVIRKRCYLSLSFDHRAADGAQADAYLSAIGRRLASFDLREVLPTPRKEGP